MKRLDGRPAEEMRPVLIQPDFFRRNDVLVSFGATKVLCFASLEERVPQWLMGSGMGWVTAEYNMLPSAGDPRQKRERPHPSGRTQEIQRLISRSLRAAVNLDILPPMTINIDCDVIVADGGTRTASITGGMVALANLVQQESRRFNAAKPLIKCLVAAVSAGVKDGQPIVDLNYIEDRDAEVDANIVGVSSGGFAEVQATNERGTFPRQALDSMLDMAQAALDELFVLQREHIRLKGL